VIDAYIAQLQGSLRGPRRARTDLVTEARDSLVDATEAYLSTGMDRGDAELRAVREFGDVRAIAAEYQAELGLMQTRRTATLVLLVIGSQAVVTVVAWRSLNFTWRPNAAYALLATTVDWVGFATLVVAALTLLACGIGARWTRVDRRIARVAGVAGLAICGFFVTASVALTAFSPLAGLLGATAPGLAVMAAWCAAPSVIAASAGRCLQAA
jgi:HAAS